MRKKLGKVDELIVSLLKKHGSLSTYDIAKKMKISWATANIHCYQLLASGILTNKEDEVKIGVKRVVWKVDEVTNS